MILNGRPAFVDFGGPVKRIQVNGRTITFEDHPWCGPSALKKNGDPLKNQPMDFLTAASLWIQQGRKMKDGICLYYTERQPITRQMGGRHYEIVGWTEPQLGN